MTKTGPVIPVGKPKGKPQPKQAPMKPKEPPTPKESLGSVKAEVKQECQTSLPQDAYPNEGKGNTLKRSRDFSPEEWEHATRELERKLEPELVSMRPGGHASVNYITGENAVRLANKIFGFNGWSTRILEVNHVLCNERNGRYDIVIRSSMEVMLKDGTVKQDVGVGAIKNARDFGDAYDTALKTAVTDGMKRCLRLFGDRLGNCLYNDGYNKEIKKQRIKR